ncbi:MAG: putative lysophospholipase [Elusimicrobia bacterium]|nr:MAG: putative lysophospholipase [Elusimicrobiota bacterium]KAF0158162.1 MAG: putative lysophospholipase [Elusimicrobiota bacterium]
MSLSPIICAVLFLAAPSRAQEPRAGEAVTFQAADGWTIHADYLPPAEGAPVVLLLHSHRSSSAEWKTFQAQLKRYGYGWLAPDMRGHGRTVTDPTGSTVTWKSFRHSGSDNEYNKMIRDVDGALVFLSTRAITTDRVIMAGSILGANLAIKTAAIYKEIPKVVAVSPVLNVNDVLVVNPLRAYGRKPLLMLAGANRERQFKEFQLLNDIAKLSCGAENVITLVEARGFGAELINRYSARRILDWLKSSSFPPVVDSSSTYVAGGLETVPWEGGPSPEDYEEEVPGEEAEGETDE